LLLATSLAQILAKFCFSPLLQTLGQAPKGPVAQFKLPDLGNNLLQYYFPCGIEK
jgi:hypothetical protein